MNYPMMQPYLSCKDLQASLDWFEKIGFRCTYKMDGPDGKPVHAEIQRAGIHFMLGGPCPEKGYEAPSSATGFYLLLGGKMFDLDGYCQELKAKGVQVEQEPKDQFYGHRTFSVKHPEGFQFTFGKAVAELDENELKQAMSKMMAASAR